MSTSSDAAQLEFFVDPATGARYSRYGTNAPFTHIVIPTPGQAPAQLPASTVHPQANGQVPTYGPADDPNGARQLAALSAASTTVPIDPALLPITTGKGKGKERAVEPTKKRKASAAASDTTDVKRPRRGGRAAGVANYSPDDIESLLDIIEEILPIGGKGWLEVEVNFASWAKENGRPVRQSKSLEAKYKQFVRTPKPTGDAECPPHIDHAHYIEDLINEKAETRELDDDEIADVVEISSDEDDTPAPTPSLPTASTRTVPVASASHSTASAPGPVASSSRVMVKTEPAAPTQFIARRAAAVRARAPNKAQDLLSSISSVLDPSARAEREDERATRSFQTTQVLALTQQLRDATATIESLRGQVLTITQRCNDAERRADRAELTSMLQGSRRGRSRSRSRSPPRRHGHRHAGSSRWRSRSRSFRTPHSRRPRRSRSRSESPQYFRRDTFYPGGGSSTSFLPKYQRSDDGLPEPSPEPGTRFVEYADGWPQPTPPRRTRAASPPASYRLSVSPAKTEQRDSMALNVVLTPSHGARKSS